MSPLTGILVGFVLVLLNGFFVAIEFALARISKPRLENRLKDEENKVIKTTKLILKAVNNIERYISSAQIGITVSSLALGAIGEITISKIVSPIVKALLPGMYSEAISHSISLPIAILIVTYFHMVIGEIIPKAFAFVRPEKTAYALIWPLEFFTMVASPLVDVLNASASTLMRPLGIKDIKTPFFYTEDELKLLVNLSQEEGILEEAETEMITNIFDFPDTVAREIMTPRIDMQCMEGRETVESAVGIVKNLSHSRIPIYEDSIDNIIGYITTRDLLIQTHKGNNSKLVRDIVKPISKYPESIAIDDLLSNLRKESLQITIIIDEFGGTSGLVTVEDIIEEIVGEIHDEYDVVEKEKIQALENGEFLIDGKANIDEVNEELNANFPYEHYDTIGGLTFGLIGKEPEIGDEVESNGYLLRVEDKDDEKSRIKLIRVIKITTSELDEESVEEEKPTTPDKKNKNELQSS